MPQTQEGHKVAEGPIYCRHCHLAIRSDGQGGFRHYFGDRRCPNSPDDRPTFAEPEPEPGPPSPPEWTPPKHRGYGW